jgi:signal transduction histidine kinase
MGASAILHHQTHTGQGTGLGLSLPYDIITKGHGGELKLETKQGEEVNLLFKYH